jgi:hypothetical protein
VGILQNKIPFNFNFSCTKKMLLVLCYTIISKNIVKLFFSVDMVYVWKHAPKKTLQWKKFKKKKEKRTP